MSFLAKYHPHFEAKADGRSAMPIDGRFVCSAVTNVGVRLCDKDSTQPQSPRPGHMLHFVFA